MKSWPCLALAVAVVILAIPAAAEKSQKQKQKPSYSEEKGTKGSAHTMRPPSNRNSSAQELRKLEQSSAKTAGSRKGDKAPRSGAVLKAEKEERNPPIQFSSAGGGSKGAKGKSANSYKGRLRHKGSHR